MQTLLDKQWNKLNSNLQLFANAGADLFGQGLYYAGTGGANRGTGVGGALNTAGLAIGNFLPGPWGAIAKVGAGFAGGLINRLFGYKLNEGNIQNIQDNINKGWGYNNTAQDWNSWAYQGANGPHVRMFDLNYIGRNGLWNNGATRKFNDLTAEQNASMSFKNRSDENTAKNIYASAALSANSKNYAEGGYVTPISNPHKASSLFDYTNLLYKNKFDGKNNSRLNKLSIPWGTAARQYLLSNGTDTDYLKYKQAISNIVPENTLPEITVKPNAETTAIVNGVREMFPKKEDRNIYYGQIYGSYRGKYPKNIRDFLNPNLFIAAQLQTYNNAGKPKINVNHGNGRSSMSPFLKHKLYLYSTTNGGNRLLPDVLRAELSHSLQFKNPQFYPLQGLYVPHNIPSGIFGSSQNGFFAPIDDLLYEIPGTNEYMAHSIIEPALKEYEEHRLLPEGDLMPENMPANLMLMQNINGNLSALNNNSDIFYDALLNDYSPTIVKEARKFIPNSVNINTYLKGGGIHIAPNKRGTFTAAATKHGLGVLDFASQVLTNKNNYSPAMVKKANFAKNAAKWHAEGGHLFEEGGRLYRHGMTYDNWLTAVNEGGTHEENPNEGVLYGVDPEGTPNLVEEGEVIRNDTNYVYSNRIKPSKEFAELWGVGKNDTMADFARKIKDGMEERRFDAIALRTAKAKLDAVLEELERVKMEQKGEEFRELVNQMSPEELYALQLMLLQGAMPGFENYQNMQQMQGQQIPMQGLGMSVIAACGGKVNRFATKGQMSIATPQFNYNMPFLGNSYYNNLKLQRAGIPPVYPKSLNLPTFGNSSNSAVPQTPASLAIFNLQKSLNNKLKGNIFNTLKEPTTYPTNGRYAGVLGQGVSAILSNFDSPDYSNIERVERAAAGIPRIAAPKINDYASYVPSDINKDIAEARQDLNATTRGIAANSGGNKAVANAGLIAALKAGAESVGKINSSIREAAQKSYFEALKHNASISAQNAESALSAAASNQSRDLEYVKLLNLLASRRDAEKIATQDLRNQINTGLLKSISEKAKENFIFNQINNNTALAYYLLNNGEMPFRGA